MGVTECSSWRQLLSQGEQAEALIERIRDEEGDSKPKSEKPAHQTNSKHPYRSKGKETLATETKAAEKPKPVQTAGATLKQKLNKQYSFKDEHVVALFKLLLNSEKLKIPETRRPEEADKVNDPKYCMYHRMLGHPTTSCYVLKDMIQALVDAQVIKLRPEQKTVTANAVTLQFGGMPPVPAGVTPIPEIELRLTNIDLHGSREKGLVPISAPKGEIMWVHPDLIKDQQWTVGTGKKARGKAKASSCNMIGVSAIEDDAQIASSTDSGQENLALFPEPEIPLAGTPSSKQIAKQDTQDGNSTTTESHSSSSSGLRTVTHMTRILEKIAKRSEEQSVVQRMQYEMLMAQQQSICELKNMMILLLEKQIMEEKARASALKPGSPPDLSPRGKANVKKPIQRTLSQFSQPKGKCARDAASTRASRAEEVNVPLQQRLNKQYSFKDEHVVALFKLLLKSEKLKIPEARRPEEADKVNDPKYCIYHRMLGHPTTSCYILKDKIQALVDAGVINLRPEQKKVDDDATSLQSKEGTGKPSQDRVETP
jgi:hypothetical protein